MDHAQSKRERVLKARHLSARRRLKLTVLTIPGHSSTLNDPGVSRYRYFSILGLASFTLSTPSGSIHDDFQNVLALIRAILTVSGHAAQLA